MPTYQDALSADPSAFLAYASEMVAAATDLASQQTDYGAKVTEINGHWQDAANEAFNDEVGNVNSHLTQVIGEVTAAAGGLAATAGQMLAECTVLKGADAALQALGFDIQPAPLVTLGPAQRTAIAMAGPFGPILEAALQAQAAAGTLGLQALNSLVNAADATAGNALSQAAELLKPLEDKSDPARDLHRMAEDHSAAGPEGANEEESTEEEEPEEEEEEQKEEEEEPTEPEDQAQEPGQSQTPQQPSTPATPSMEDLAQPEMPELDSPWDASGLKDPDDLSGGLASGAGAGGLGGGAGGLSAGGLGGVPAGGAPTGMGGATMLGAPAGTPTGAKSGAKGGAGGGMTGGGGRGAGAGNDDGTERESTLVEDPDEDVWGIAKAADDLYE